MLAEDANVAGRLLDVLDEVPCRGKHVHDANVVVTMLVHGIDTPLTMNVADFSPFERLARVISLSGAQGRRPFVSATWPRAWTSTAA
ncbi:MAG TPA: hypothetical protein VME44_16635 [Streptosporangiaceae bacterium]|nr:hypothetical protein [Streptosporangiaceae bacterium]